MRTQVKGQSWYRAISVRFPQWTYLVDSHNPNISDSYALINWYQHILYLIHYWLICKNRVSLQPRFTESGRSTVRSGFQRDIDNRSATAVFVSTSPAVRRYLFGRPGPAGRGENWIPYQEEIPAGDSESQSARGSGKGTGSTDPVRKQDGGQVRWHVGQQDSNEWKLLRAWLNTLDTQLYTYQFKIICMQCIFIDQQQWSFCWKDIYMLID